MRPVAAPAVGDPAILELPAVVETRAEGRAELVAEAEPHARQFQVGGLTGRRS